MEFMRLHYPELTRKLAQQFNNQTVVAEEPSAADAMEAS